MTSKALNVAMIHRNLRAARYTAGHCEGATSDWVDIRSSDTKITMEYDDFVALAEAVLAMPVGPTISVAGGPGADF